MELFKTIDATDHKVITRVREIDAEKAATKDYVTIDNQPFELAQFVANNLLETDLSAVQARPFEILFMACLTDIKDREGCLNIVKNMITEERLDANVVEVTDFVIELAEVLENDMGLVERTEQLKLFQELILYEQNAAAHPGTFVVQKYRETTYGLHYLDASYMMIVLLLTPQPNFKDVLAKHPVSKRICRRLHYSYDLSDEHWAALIDYSEIASSINRELLLQIPFFKMFSAVMLEKSEMGHGQMIELLHQAFTIYRPNWRAHWTRVGWRANRVVTKRIELFRGRHRVLFHEGQDLELLFRAFGPVKF